MTMDTYGALAPFRLNPRGDWKETYFRYSED